MTCGVEEHSDLNWKEESQGKRSQKYDLLVWMNIVIPHVSLY